MRTTWTRRLAGAAVLAVLAGAVASDSTAAVPAEAYPKAIEADIAHLTTIVEMAKTKKKMDGRIKATALLIASHAQASLGGTDGDKMAALRTQALKVAAAAEKKDLPAATAAAKELATVKADKTADKKALKLATMNKLVLSEVMDLFGGAVGGGMNIERDIRTMKKEGVKDAKAAEVIATRTAAIADFTFELPPDFGGKKKKEDWIRWTTDMKTQATELATEAGKGAKADAAKLKKLVASLDASCTNCHNIFREE